MNNPLPHHKKTSPTSKSTGKSTRTQCEWRLDSDPDMTVWHSSCGNIWEFTEGGPADNQMKFCPFCGLPLHEDLRATDENEIALDFENSDGDTLQSGDYD